MSEFKLNSQMAYLRKARGLTQEEVAQALGVTNQAVSKWESSQCCPDIQLLPEIASFFNVSIDELIGCKGVGTTDRLMLDVCSAIEALSHEKEEAETTLKFAYTLHAVLFSKVMQIGENLGWNPVDAILHAKEAEWGMSCITRPMITSTMRYGSVFFSDNKNLNLRDDRITKLCAVLRDLSHINAIRVFVAIYTLTVEDESIYRSIGEIAEYSKLSKATVEKHLGNSLSAYLGVKDIEGELYYRIIGEYMHMLPILAMICNP